jgi:septal ring factor EnvC (AmiA/AmiB activator)
VVRGEGLYGIARLYGATVQDIRTANHLAEDYVLKVGDILNIPQAVGTVGTVSAAAGRAPNTAGTTTTTSPNARPTVTGTVDASVRWPVDAKEVVYMTGKLYGVALLGERTESVKSLTQGTVVSAGAWRGFGKVAIVEMTGGYLYVYGGCESLSVKAGDRVLPGTELGKLGIDGISAKPQLFFLVYKSSTAIDPARAPRA